MPVLENPKHEKFAQLRAGGMSADEAYEKAGFRRNDANAARLNGNDRVRARIAEILQPAADEVAVTVLEVIRELKLLAFSDPGDAYDENGRLLPMDQMPPHIRRAIAGVEVEELFEGRGQDRERIGDLVKVKWWNKPQTLEMLGRHLKMFTDKLEIEGLDALAEKLKRARERGKR